MVSTNVMSAKPAHRNPGELLQRQQPGKQTAPYVESTCEQPVYKLAELLCLPVNSVRPVWNTGFQRDLKGLREVQFHYLTVFLRIFMKNGVKMVSKL